MKHLILQILIGAAVFGSFVSASKAQQSNGAQRTTEVDIYLLRADKTAEEDKKNPFGLTKVKRTVDARAPLRNALIALTDGGVTEKEAAEKLFAPVWGIRFVSVRLSKGTAYTYFTMPEEARFPGDNAPDIFKAAVEQTALQFKTVKRVVVCLDGLLDFDNDSEVPSRRCKQ